MPPRPFALAAAVVFLLPATSSAHNLYVKAFPQADPIRVEASFDTDDPADGAKVIVRDAAGAVVATGATDEKGVWAFPRPGPGRYTVRVELAGHEAETEPFAIGGPGPEAVETRRPDRFVGAVVGVGLLLGVSLLAWVRRRRRV